MVDLGHSGSFEVDPAVYALMRPTYPPELFRWVSSLCEGHSLAWDCATGNGQAAIGLADYFERVQATDTNPGQIAAAIARPNVDYAVGAAESSGFADQVFDAVVAAQALHWFDLSRYWIEVSRVARPNALFCAWGYDWFNSPREIDETIVAPLRAVLGPYWPRQSRILWRGYRPKEVGCPFTPIAAPDFEIRVSWTPAQIFDYMRTWSAYRRASRGAAARAIDAIVAHNRQALASAVAVPIRMPLKVLAGFITAQ